MKCCLNNKNIMMLNIKDKIFKLYGKETEYNFERDYVNNPLQLVNRNKNGGKMLEMPTKNDIYELYINMNLSTNDIKHLLNTSNPTVNKWLRYYNIKKDKNMIYSDRELKTRKTNFKRYGSETYRNYEKFIESINKKNKDGLFYVRVREKRRNTCKILYGNEVYRNHDKHVKTCNELYGVDYYNNRPLALETFNEHKKDISFLQERDIKSKKTRLERYGDENYNNIEKIRETNMRNMGVNHPMESKEVWLKGHNTKKQNGIYKKQSKEEEQIEKILLSKYSDVISQWNDDDYPGIADFYIPSINTIIEYQGTWLHGPKFLKCHEPYDSTNNKHLEAKIIMENKNTPYYDNAINVWTIKDPCKREWAKTHQNYVWLEFFDMKKFNEWFIKQ